MHTEKEKTKQRSEKVRKKSLIFQLCIAFPELLADRLDENFRLLLRRQSVTVAESVQSYGRYGQSTFFTVCKVDKVRAVGTL